MSTLQRSSIPTSLHKRGRREMVLAASACLLLALAAYSICAGAVPISLGELWQALSTGDTASKAGRIIHFVRLPRTLAALLAGCAAPAVPEAASAVQAVSSEAGTGHAGSRTEQLAVLDGLVDFGADTAGCSLKTARAAAVLVEYLSASEFEDGTADTWRAGLSGDAQERLALNWPGILAEAQAICADPAACADELASAGVETDFPGMELGGVPDKLTALDAVLCAQGQP